MQIRHAIHFQLSDFNYLIKGIDDTLEVRNLQGSTTNQTAVNIRVGKQFLCIRRLTAATIKDRAVVSNFLTILFSNQGTDESVDFLCLFCSSSLTGTDSLDKLELGKQKQESDLQTIGYVLLWFILPLMMVLCVDILVVRRREKQRLRQQ
jgi:hypothetical protein